VYISIISKSDTFALNDVNCAYNKVWAIVFLYYETHVHIIAQAFYCCLLIIVKIFVPLKHLILLCFFDVVQVDDSVRPRSCHRST